MTDELLEIPRRKIKSILRDPAKAAAAVQLVYVCCQDPGITRKRTGKKNFSYFLGDEKLTDKEHLDRIKKLVIPPAWEDVWICVLPNGHLQATGLDLRKRRQYRYHSDWNQLRNQTKFYHIIDFGKSLPDMRAQIKKDLSLPGLPAEKVLATIVSLMERTNIRVGNSVYEKIYGSFGLTTLKDKHVSLNGSKIGFRFKGKKGVEHTISIKNRKLASIVKKCKEIPGKELFQYYDENGDRKAIDSGMVNEYIKKISGADFTAKDFRTWAGTVQALIAFKEIGAYETETEAKRKVAEAFRMVSKQLGNTPNVCKKYYVHPSIISLYQNRELEKYIPATNGETPNEDRDIIDLTEEEKAVLQILESL